MKNLINTRLEEIRKEHKLSRKALEEISGFKARTIESYERGQNPPSKEYLEFISLYFGYKKEYIEGKSENKFLDYVIRVLLMYQKIFNYDDKKMCEKLIIEENKYKDFYEFDFEKIEDFKRFDFIFDFAFKCNIKLISFFPELLKKDILEESNKTLTKDINFENTVKKSFYYQKIGAEMLIEFIETNDINGIEIHPRLYAEYIKLRNTPLEITPDTQKESIPDKYKEILELLPYASDNFLHNLEKKLLELKKAQQIEDL
jgi:transcriptional regulator with XRE-family HTH domain